MKKRVFNLVIGAAFGVALVRTGSADFDEMMRMFSFTSFHLFGVAIVATLASIVSLNMLRRVGGHTRLTSLITWPRRPVHKGTVVGSVIFGFGWAISGSCPGTALAQLGQGHLIALATVAGIIIGSRLFDVFNRRYLRIVVSCE